MLDATVPTITILDEVAITKIKIIVGLYFYGVIKSDWFANATSGNCE